jgi:Holliday junction DNA helicase RuvA
MFAHLRGHVVRRETDSIVVDVNGVGYEVFCTIRTAAKLSAGETADLHIHTSVSDDAIRLYGFVELNELRFFRLLIGVERIGPKAALAILGRAELDVMSRAITAGDATLLSSVPGIGRKTAERLILELRDKLSWLSPSADQVLPINGAPVSSAAEGAIVALVGLGFKNEAARKAVEATGVEAGDDTTSIVSAALRVLDTAS